MSKTTKAIGEAIINGIAAGLHPSAGHDIRMLAQFPLDELARVTGQSEEALIAEFQSSPLDYEEFYYLKMRQRDGPA